MSGFIDDGAHPVPDGPSDGDHHPRGGGIDAKIAALQLMSTTDLQTAWQRLYQTPPPIRMSRDLLLRGVAYKIQEQAYGGLSLSTKRKLRSKTDPPGGAPVAFRAGTKLVREWHGRVHTVNTLENGFEYQGEHYRSLSRIARQITGVHWSGPLFFGISQRSPRRDPSDE